MQFRFIVAFIFAAIPFGHIFAEDAKADAPKLDIQLKDVKKQTTLVIKKTVKREDIGKELGEIYPKIFKFLGEKKITPNSAPMAKYKMTADGFEMEAGVVVPDGTKGEGDIVAGELPEGKVVTTTHLGAYDKLPNTYQAIGEWLKTKGLISAGIGWEIYISDPGTTKPEEVKTEVYLLTAPEKKDK
jgi:effector-binding domain-containing protein